jgi:hypothetical protein
MIYTTNCVEALNRSLRKINQRKLPNGRSGV